MKDLNTILSEMDDEIFKRDYGDYNASPHINPDYRDIANKYGIDYELENAYIEDIPPVIAKSLVPIREFDEDCRYQILILNEVTLVLKIDDKFPPDIDVSLNKHVTEYVLKSDDVQTLDELQRSIVNRDSYSLTSCLDDNDEPKTRVRWSIVIAAVILTQLGIGLGLFYFIVNYLK